MAKGPSRAYLILWRMMTLAWPSITSAHSPASCAGPQRLLGQSLQRGLFDQIHTIHHYPRSVSLICPASRPGHTDKTKRERMRMFPSRSSFFMFACGAWLMIGSLVKTGQKRGRHSFTVLP